MAALKLIAERYPQRGRTTIPVVIRDTEPDDAYVLTLVENLQREDLSPREESEALGRLVRERRWSTRQIASAISRSQPYVSRRLRVYQDRALRALVLDTRLSVSVAEELLAAEPDKRSALAKRAAHERWDQKRARAEARGHTAAFHPQLREHVGAIRELVSHATLSRGEKELLRELAEHLLAAVPTENAS
jgi:ParB-like chromosome segregation protein Spo0J